MCAVFHKKRARLRAVGETDMPDGCNAHLQWIGGWFRFCWDTRTSWRWIRLCVPASSTYLQRVGHVSRELSSCLCPFMPVIVLLLRSMLNSGLVIAEHASANSLSCRVRDTTEGSHCVVDAARCRRPLRCLPVERGRGCIHANWNDRMSRRME